MHGSICMEGIHGLECMEAVLASELVLTGL